MFDNQKTYEDNPPSVSLKLTDWPTVHNAEAVERLRIHIFPKPNPGHPAERVPTEHQGGKRTQSFHSTDRVSFIFALGVFSQSL